MSGSLVADRGPGLSPAQLVRAFPFFIHVDRFLVIQSFGPSLRKAMRVLQPGVKLGALFEAQQPMDASNAAAWAAHPGELVTLTSRSGGALTLRGSSEPMEDGSWLLLVSPVFAGVSEMVALGLEFSDIAKHDAAADLLLARRTVELSLDDARRLATRLRARTHQLETILELSAGGVLYFDATGTLMHCNEALEATLEMPRDELIGRSLAQVDEVLVAMLAPRDRRRQILQQLAVCEGGEPGTTTTVQLQLPMHKTVQIRHRTSAEGESVFYLVDITRETEVDRMKSEFLSTAAHELRTPMVSVFGFTELLLKREYPPERRREMLETVHRQTGVLVHLVNELLDLSRIEARRGQDFLVHDHELMALVTHAVDGLMVPGDGRQVRLINDMFDPAPTVQVDAEKFGLALTNVLSNAYKYSPAGGEITLRVRPAVMGDLPAVSVEVGDQGMGMSPEQQSRLFERFWRADPSGRIPGTGLGMCLVKEILELLGGQVDVQSAIGVGTTVSLTLPCSETVRAEVIPVATVIDMD